MRTIQELHNIDIVEWTDEELEEAIASVPNETDNDSFSNEEVEISRQVLDSRYYNRK